MEELGGILEEEGSDEKEEDEGEDRVDVNIGALKLSIAFNGGKESRGESKKKDQTDGLDQNFLSN